MLNDRLSPPGQVRPAVRIEDSPAVAQIVRYPVAHSRARKGHPASRPAAGRRRATWPRAARMEQAAGQIGGKGIGRYSPSFGSRCRRRFAMRIQRHEGAMPPPIIPALLALALFGAMLYGFLVGL